MTWFDLVKKEEWDFIFTDGENKLNKVRHLDWNKLTSQSKEKVIDGYINFWIEEHPDDVGSLPPGFNSLDWDIECIDGVCKKPSDWDNNHYTLSDTDSFSIILYNDRYPMITALVPKDNKIYPIGEGKAKEWMMTKLNMNHLKTEKPSNIMVEAALLKLMEFEK
tara:strand:- start:5305 stop:5796 length:492 start_codon:yes stop_codon:yes gene_type:complete